MTAPTAEQFLTNSGKPAKLERIGEYVQGDIIDDPQMMQQRDYETENLTFYADGAPAMQLVIRLQTEQRDPDKPDDDGVRTIYVKGQLKTAVIAAMRGLDHNVPRKGGVMRVTLTGLEPVKLKNGKPGNDKKIHEVKYRAPAAAQADAYLSEPSPAAAGDTSRNIVSPAPQWPACPPGVDPPQWQAMNGGQRAQMYQAFGYPVPQATALPRGHGLGGGGFDDEPPF